MPITVSDVKDVIKKLSDIIIENEKYFCELDSVAGDGDFGMSLAKGFREISNKIDTIDASTIHKFLRGCSMIISEYCGGASGPIWGSAFGAAANSANGKDTIELLDLHSMFESAIEAIQKRGGAKQGDKTLLDALIPATLALKEGVSNNFGLLKTFQNVAIKAKEGAEATKNMIAMKGRASYVGERSLSYPDAGAMALSVIFDAFLT